MGNPRNTLAALFAAALAPAIVLANGLHLHGTLNGESDYVYSDDNHELVLHSNAHTGGVVVDRTRPAPLHGVQAGDLIVSVDGHAVAGVEDVENELRHHRTGTISLSIRRAGAAVTLGWSQNDARLMFPDPPAPPEPPAPPAPPEPPAPPVPPAHR